jgi:hypothetical protein
MEKGEARKEAEPLQSACEKNRKIIRRSRELLAVIDRRLSTNQQNAPNR